MIGNLPDGARASVFIRSSLRAIIFVLPMVYFKIKMKELGIYPAEDGYKAPPDPDTDWFRWLTKFWGKERKGTSTLNKWTCPDCGVNVRMGIARDPILRHHSCETVAGHQVYLIPGDVYVAKK